MNMHPKVLNDVLCAWTINVCRKNTIAVVLSLSISIPIRSQAKAKVGTVSDDLPTVLCAVYPCNVGKTDTVKMTYDSLCVYIYSGNFISKKY